MDFQMQQLEEASKKVRSNYNNYRVQSAKPSRGPTTNQSSNQSKQPVHAESNSLTESKHNQAQRSQNTLPGPTHSYFK